MAVSDAKGWTMEHGTYYVGKNTGLCGTISGTERSSPPQSSRVSLARLDSQSLVTLRHCFLCLVCDVITQHEQHLPKSSGRDVVS
jgi:hypothetical protein